MGARCCACGLPLHHDHYVPVAGGLGFKIYRGSRDDGGGQTWEPGETPVRFGPEHAWLKNALGLARGIGPPIIRGPVEDGVIRDAGESYFVADADDAFGYHEACWRLIGSPANADAALLCLGRHGYAMLSVYDAQLFDLRELVADGKAWMLADPDGSSEDSKRSRARIEALIAEARRGKPANVRPRNVAEVLATDSAWRGVTLRKGDVRTDQIRFRDDVAPGLDVSGYPALVWLMKEYVGDPQRWPSVEVRAELEAFEMRVKEAVEADAAAIVVETTLGRSQLQCLIYAKDEAATVARIDALPGRESPTPNEYENEDDPEWNVYFEQMDPHRYVR